METVTAIFLTTGGVFAKTPSNYFNLTMINVPTLIKFPVFVFCPLYKRAGDGFDLIRLIIATAHLRRVITKK